ncbi:uncharacterized protein TNIN_21641 [Trichonephila inaurata madagascariensis]|uniref:Uncharacterized protein n=1 Tax=Trichonephila inaurata madagascariensis TaxID=2747483 RepID=A0A8X6YME8_9ARAC|nr:uncharacterized protein TNIN_21641 [Trichonephila inaurata madagascariensis]
MDSSPMRLDLKTVLPTFISDKDDISLFLTMFERQMKLLNVPADFWVSHLIGILPSDIGRLIAREPEEMFKNYAHIRNIFLQRFKLTADRFRVLFCRHQKQDHSIWKDFFFELRTFFEGWLSELEIESFETLKDLIITDQIKKGGPPDCKNHFLDTWEKLNDPVLLAEKLDSYENVKPSSLKSTKLPKPQELNTRFSRNTGNPQFRKSHSELKRMFRVTTTVLLLILATCQHGIPTLVAIHLFLAMVVATRVGIPYNPSPLVYQNPSFVFTF